MTMLVTRQQAKDHLYITHTSDDSLIDGYIMAASEAVINYLKETAEDFVDSSGDLIMTTDSPPESTAPRVVEQATLLMVGWFYNYREGENDKMTPGYLPAPVVSLLYPLRDPGFA